MNQVIGKIRAKGTNEVNKYKKIISNKTLYTLPEDIDTFIPYDPSHNLDEDSWFGINNFSEKEYCLDCLKESFSSTTYNLLKNEEANNLDFMFSYQNGDQYFFQKISKSQLLNRKTISVGDRFEYNENSKNIVVNSMCDALYLKSRDTLYFKKLSTITGIFKGIDSLYREATQRETEEFLENDFIETVDEFSAVHVKTANRKRIAVAIDLIKSFEDDQKKIVFDSIKDYCPRLVTDDGSFKVGSEEELKLLLYGIEQRFYTTPDGREKRIANSVISFSNIP